jgi:hypothetical protein
MLSAVERGAFRGRSMHERSKGLQSGDGVIDVEYVDADEKK